MSIQNPYKSQSQLLKSQPEWYAQRAIITKLQPIAIDDKSIDLSDVSVGFAVGDVVAFINLQDSTQQTVTLCKVQKVFATNSYKFVQQIPTGEHKYMIIKMACNNFDLQPNQLASLIPITHEILQSDAKSSTPKLKALGITSPGWYRWRAIEKSDGTLMIRSNLLISMKGFHGPLVPSEGNSQFVNQDGIAVIQFDQQGNITLA